MMGAWGRRLGVGVGVVEGVADGLLGAELGLETELERGSEAGAEEVKEIEAGAEALALEAGTVVNVCVLDGAILPCRPEGKNKVGSVVL